MKIFRPRAEPGNPESARDSGAVLARAPERRHSLDRGVDEAAYQRTEIFALAEALRHEDGNSSSFGSIQKKVPAIPLQKNWPTEPAKGAIPSMVRTAKPRPKL
jgi:hypothetical protein